MRTIKRLIAGAFIVSADNYILLGKSTTGLYDGCWIVPGGGIEQNETIKEAVIRETYEEVGLDIATAKMEPFSETLTGSSEKVLSDTDERVFVEMEFHDYIVKLGAPAKDIKLTSGEDFADATWHPVATLSTLVVSPAIKQRFNELGYL